MTYIRWFDVCVYLFAIARVHHIMPHSLLKPRIMFIAYGLNVVSAGTLFSAIIDMDGPRPFLGLGGHRHISLLTSQFVGATSTVFSFGKCTMTYKLLTAFASCVLQARIMFLWWRHGGIYDYTIVELLTSRKLAVTRWYGAKSLALWVEIQYYMQALTHTNVGPSRAAVCGWSQIVVQQNRDNKRIIRLVVRHSKAFATVTHFSHMNDGIEITDTIYAEIGRQNGLLKYVTFVIVEIQRKVHFTAVLQNVANDTYLTVCARYNATVAVTCAKSACRRHDGFKLFTMTIIQW